MIKNKKKSVINDAPILPPNIIKVPFDGNKQYRIFLLKEVLPDGSQNRFYITDSKGNKTDSYREEFVNGKWIYREEIPYNAFVKYFSNIDAIE